MKKGWEIKKLGEVADIINGGTPKTNVLEYWDGDINWITPADLGKLKNPEVEDTPRKLTKLGLDKSSAKLFPENSVILSTRAPIGHLAINTAPMSTNQGCRGIVPKEKLDFRFLYFFLKNNIDLLDSLGTGATFKELSTKSLAGLVIPIPPLPEQQRIVSIIDECFTAIDQAKANAEQNLKNARELFESYLQGVFANGKWETRKIQEIAKVINGYAFASYDFNPTNKIKSVKITNVGVKEFIEDTDNYLPEKYKETLRDFQVTEGNIVIALTRTIISSGLKVAVVPSSYDGALVNQRVAALISNEKLVNQNYLYLFLTTSYVAKYVLAHVNTLMQPNLSISDLKNMSVPVPSLKEQNNIVVKLEELRTESQKLKVLYQQKVASLEELKKSILKKAFAGELSTRDITLN
ncbi:restriction endonuclease S subunit [Bacteroidales bacterium 6E]|nr:restriction endonuclease S subunit [Bacteroidales bacterium 6E]